jgi:predicted RNA-binding Zn-ribbon protein involved in translation (DUF1610 family)
MHEHSTNSIVLPTCPNCGLEMQRHRSEVVRLAPLTRLHLFNCPTCCVFAESETANEPLRVLLADNCAASEFRFFAKRA